MAEYVDITKLKERIRYDFDYSLQLCEDIIEVTDSLPTIEIVHCENCVHYIPDEDELENCGECTKLRDNVCGDDSTRVFVGGDFFCQYGAEKLYSERKE